jgi:hypothetical protein
MRQNRGGAAWVSIASPSGTQVKKKNLTSKMGYQFRIRPVTDHDGEPWSPPSEAMVPRFNVPTSSSTPRGTTNHSKQAGMMAAPWCKNAGAKQSILVCWQTIDGASGYELQMRENQKGSMWATIAPNVQGTEVKKKNLPSKNGYQFRVRPLGKSDLPNFSQPSYTAIAT